MSVGVVIVRCLRRTVRLHPRGAAWLSEGPGYRGAMTFQPWKRRLRTTRLSRRTTFNGAMALQPWKRGLSSAASCTSSTFNGAMAFQPWKPSRRPHACTHRLGPSMEPWPFSHGNWELVEAGHAEIVPSMEPWPFSHGNTTRSSNAGTPGETFNGAMALQPWKRIPARQVAPAAALPVMEPWPFSHGYRQTRRRRKPDRVRPSIEPWPFSHGNLGLAWLVAVVGDPSMEPWPFSHGNFRGLIPDWAWQFYLQWSHGPSAMETSGREWPSWYLAVLQWSHGPSAMETCKTVKLRSGTSPFNGAMALQPWKPPLPKDSDPRPENLQWSHGPSAMETSSGDLHAPPDLLSFNGAMALQPWKPDVSRGDGHGQVGPSMEPWPFSHGNDSRGAGRSG